ncbi:MAG TPA: hypothetical protein VJR67_01930 [Candidatus Nitrosopolaris sp.]|nr:hypothetical protein [Candidatus Nitrosopolaris sp.]
MEELDFLHEVSLTALYSNRSVKFAAVLDNNGKLIIAKYRSRRHGTEDLPNKTPYSFGQSYLFHQDYIIPAIKNRRLYSLNSAKEGHQQRQQEEEVHFEIIELDKNIRLAIAPLNETRNKYLCMYVESSAPNQEIISKLRDPVI